MSNPTDSSKKSATLSDYMHRDIVTIPVTATLQDAGKMMQERSVGALLVVEGKEYVGIVSEKRLAREGTGQGRNPETTLVKDIMRPSPIGIESSKTVKEAQDVMKGNGVRHLVVRENGQIVGILGLSDLIRYYTDFFDEDS